METLRVELTELDQSKIALVIADYAAGGVTPAEVLRIALFELADKCQPNRIINQCTGIDHPEGIDRHRSRGADQD